MNSILKIRKDKEENGMLSNNQKNWVNGHISIMNAYVKLIGIQNLNDLDYKRITDYVSVVVEKAGDKKDEVRELIFDYLETLDK